MIFKVSRVSCDYGNQQPCEKAYECLSYPDVFPSQKWEIEITTLEDLINFVKKYGGEDDDQQEGGDGVIVTSDPPMIRIYDGYNE